MKTEVSWGKDEESFRTISRRKNMFCSLENLPRKRGRVVGLGTWTQ